MQTKQLLLPLAIATPAALTLALCASSYSAPADSVEFRPSGDDALIKTFDQTTSMVIDDMVMVMNGQEMPPEMMPSDLETSTAMHFVVSDQYSGVGEGRAAKLRRSYEELSSVTEFSASMPPPLGDMDESMDGISELEGMTVVFAYDEDDEEYQVGFAEEFEDEDEALLDDLWEDMDLRALLPAGAVSEGDSWRVDNELMSSLLAPGGNLKIMPEEANEMMGMGPGGDFSNMAGMMGEFEGTSTGTYQGAREVDGREVGVIAVQVAVHSASDVTDMLRQAMESMDVENLGEMEMDFESADVEMAFDGEGELLWDLEGGHFHSFEMELDLEFAMDLIMTMSMMGTDMDMEQSMEMSGSWVMDASSAREE